VRGIGAHRDRLRPATDVRLRSSRNDTGHFLVPLWGSEVGPAGITVTPTRAQNDLGFIDLLDLGHAETLHHVVAASCVGFAEANDTSDLTRARRRLPYRDGWHRRRLRQCHQRQIGTGMRNDIDNWD
jgi:hypothetical protein